MTLAALVLGSTATNVNFHYATNDCSDTPGNFEASTPICLPSDGKFMQASCRDGRYYTTQYTTDDCSGTEIIVGEAFGPHGCDVRSFRCAAWCHAAL